MISHVQSSIESRSQIDFSWVVLAEKEKKIR
jgi:hypothetical protein